MIPSSFAYYASNYKLKTQAVSMILLFYGIHIMQRMSILDEYSVHNID